MAQRYDITAKLTAVLVAAEHRCQCTGIGMCGRKRHGESKRCEHCMPNHSLIAAPTDLSIPFSRAVRMPAAELQAWCTDCYARARTRVRREAQREADRQLAEAQCELFDAETTTGDREVTA